MDQAGAARGVEKVLRRCGHPDEALPLGVGPGTQARLDPLHQAALGESSQGELGVDERSRVAHRHPRKGARDVAHRRTQPGEPVLVDPVDDEVSPLPRQPRGDQQPGLSARRVPPSYLQDLGHRQQAPHQRQHGGVGLRGMVRVRRIEAYDDTLAARFPDERASRVPAGEGRQ